MESVSPTFTLKPLNAMQSPVHEAELLTWTDLVSIQKKHDGITFPLLKTLVINVDERVTPTMEAPLLERIRCEFPGAMVSTEWLCQRVATHHPKLSCVELNRPDTTSSALIPYLSLDQGKMFGDRGISLDQLKSIPQHVGGLSLYAANFESIHATIQWLEYAYGDAAFDAESLSKKRAGSRWGYFISECTEGGDDDHLFNTSKDFPLNMGLGMTWISAILFKFPGLFSTITISTIGSIIESPELDRQYFAPILEDISQYHDPEAAKLNVGFLIAVEHPLYISPPKIQNLLVKMTPEECNQYIIQWVYGPEDGVQYFASL